MICPSCGEAQLTEWPHSHPPMTEPQDVLAEALRREIEALPCECDSTDGRCRGNHVSRAAVLAIEARFRAALVRTPETLDVERLAEDVRYAGGNGTSDYWRGFNDGIDKLSARLAASPAPDPGAGLRELADAASQGPYVFNGYPFTLSGADAEFAIAAANYVRSLLAPSAEPPETETT